MVSIVAHAVLLVLAALYVVAQPPETKELALATSVDQESEEPEFSLLEDEVELEELEVSDAPAVNLNADFNALNNVAAPQGAPEISSVDTGDLGMAGEIGALFGENGSGMKEVGGGGGSATFFGVKTSGNRFVYVVDNSNSMSSGKFETAVYELLKSVGQLSEKQRFYVIFFSDAPYPLFYPHSAQGWVPATGENKLKLEYWLRTVQRCLQTRGSETMNMAFELYPDAIYILGDGSFTDGAVEETLARSDRNVTIHTLGFNMKDKARKGFQDIAEAFGGRFTEVEVPPAMVKLSKQMNRPRNSKQNGVWGIKLGKGK